MKKITFPHMGNLYIPVETFFKELGLEVVTPPRNSQKTLDLGVKYCPEFACLPLKINIGNFIQGLENGADTIIMGGGVGPCRFGYYCEVQKEILRDLGYDFTMITIEPEIGKTLKNIYRFINKISWKNIYRAGQLTWQKIIVMDKIHRLVIKTRGQEKKEGLVDRLYQKFLTELRQVWTVKEIHQLDKEYSNALNAVKGNFKKGIEIKVGIVGEIYVVLEPFTNLNIEKKLGKLGATVNREIYISNWILDFLNISNQHEKIKKAAYPYLKTSVGGHGLDTIGNSVLYSHQGFDGVIQIAPFTCMPEIVAKSILPLVGKMEKINILSLIFDEHTGEAGLNTRLEAFIDLLSRNKKLKGVKMSG